MALLVVLGAWLLLAPIAALAVGTALRLADRAERPAPEDADAPCPPAAEAAVPARLAAGAA